VFLGLGLRWLHNIAATIIDVAITARNSTRAWDRFKLRGHIGRTPPLKEGDRGLRAQESRERKQYGLTRCTVCQCCAGMLKPQETRNRQPYRYFLTYTSTCADCALHVFPLSCGPSTLSAHAQVPSDGPSSTTAPVLPHLRLQGRAPPKSGPRLRTGAASPPTGDVLEVQQFNGRGTWELHGKRAARVRAPEVSASDAVSLLRRRALKLPVRVLLLSVRDLAEVLSVVDTLGRRGLAAGS
jgi:hypothetical protein